ncbi:MAG: C25 family cysteine peptidase [candidate division WOR-3 bacterium]
MVSFRARCALAFLLLAGAATAEQGGKYLIIAADQFVGAVQPLAAWKTKKGVLAKVVPKSEAGSTSAQIQAYIRNAYSNWPVRPEYVLLVGAPSLIPAYGNVNDCYYGDMGGTSLMEISVGRFSVSTARECSLLVNKTLAYERPSPAGDTTWFVRGTTVVREDSPADPYYQPDSRFVRKFWENSGFALCESLCSLWGHNSSHVNSAAADGRSFITYRGQGTGSWWPPFNTIAPSSWNNGAKLPIVVAGTCATITLAPGEKMISDSMMLAGTVSGLGGAVAYFGTTSSGTGISSRRGACYRGFFAALFAEKQHRLGPATLRGRFQVDSLYPGEPTRYWEWNLLGDPELNVWTGKPRQTTVEFDSVIHLGRQDFVVQVGAGGSAVSGALVCCLMDSTVYATGLTDGSGRAVLDINPANIGMMAVTVTGSNLLPFEGSARVMVADRPHLVIDHTLVDDFSGNHDGIINPGERCRLSPYLRNVGGMPANSVSAVLRLSDSHITLLDSLAGYGTIGPDSTVAGDPFEISVDTLVGEGYSAGALLRVQDAEGDSWNCGLGITVRAGRIEVATQLLLDSAPGGNGNGRLGRNESGRLQIGLRNCGGGPLAGVIVLLERIDTNVVVVDSTAAYGALGAGAEKPGSFDCFAVAAGPNLPRNNPVRFRLRVRGSGGTYNYSDTASVSVQAEQGVSSDPTGPDAYGYWCYDDTDTESGRQPTYNWLELAPPGPGTVIPVVSDSDAATIVTALPFRFRYYGVEYDSISICSNGFLGLGRTAFRSGTNRPIPDTVGPPAMLAPFWDDLNPDENANGFGTAYQYHDAANGRWIVEFKDFAHYGYPSIRETFQAILCDPTVWPTPTGDGEVVYMYNRVSLASSVTVGIEDHTETRGIQYLYNNSYAPSAAWLQAGRALRFTTWPPRNLNSPWLTLVRVQVSDTALGNGNGLLEAGESLEVVITVRNRGLFDALGTTAALHSLEPDAAVFDSLAALGTIPPGGEAANSGQPFRLVVAEVPDDSLLNFQLNLGAGEYVTTAFFSVGLDGVSGLKAGSPELRLRTGLAAIRPNPLSTRALVNYALGSAGQADLALFDALGRRVLNMATGRHEPGEYSAVIPAAELSQGIYFCRLVVRDSGRQQRFVRKIQIAR